MYYISYFYDVRTSLRSLHVAPLFSTCSAALQPLRPHLSWEYMRMSQMHFVSSSLYPRLLTSSIVHHPSHIHTRHRDRESDTQHKYGHRR